MIVVIKHKKGCRQDEEDIYYEQMRDEGRKKEHTHIHIHTEKIRIVSL